LTDYGTAVYACLMHGVVITRTFQRDADDAGLTDDEVFEIAAMIAADPLAGDLMAGTGGARKLRHAGRGKGKSGGYRTIHYFGGSDVPVFLLAIYRKGDKDNLSTAERNVLASILPKLTDTYRSRKKK
jgi:hypothetical protein